MVLLVLTWLTVLGLSHPRDYLLMDHLFISHLLRMILWVHEAQFAIFFPFLKTHKSVSAYQQLTFSHLW